MTRRRRIRVPSKPTRYAIIAQEYLEHAEALWVKADFDTAVRDDVAVGLAYIIRAAFDCQALDYNLQGLEFSLYIEQKTAEWFRKREFSEWFCLAAASGFNTSRPRSIDDYRFLPVRRKRSKAPSVERSKTRRKEPKPAKAKP
jgi:hypothetical protein